MTHPRGNLPESIGGRYRIESRIGAGGMGVVYKARDSRLNRPVAIKAIHDHRMKEGGQGLRTEALAAASLDHPYICKVYELFEDQTEFYLVMEFVEGETLASILRRGPVPLPMVLEIGSEVAEGLAHAHRRGLVHRDIKPSNVMVTPHGHVKLLDFGLAQPDVITSPAERTRTSPSGSSDYAGTPQYMAPEQALGSPVSARADLFSLGVILFEAITGRLPFAGASGYDYVRHLLSDDPRPMERLVPDIPLDLARLVHRCLEKTPADRPESADAVLAELRRLGASLSSSGAPLPTARDARVQSRTRNLAGLAGVAALVVVAWAVWPTPAPVEILDRSRQFVTWGTLESGSRVSPGGDWVSFFAMEGDRRRLFVQPVSGGDAIAVALADGRPDSHAWSPDGTEIACLIDQTSGPTLHVVPPFGGPARQRVAVADQAVQIEIVRWVDRSVFLKAGPTLSRLDLDTGTLTDVSPAWPVTGRLGDIDVSPDGRRVVYALSHEGRQDLWTAVIDGTRARQLTDDEYFERRPLFRGAGDAVVYQSNRGGPIGLWELTIGTGRSRPLTSGAGLDVPGGSSSDGRVLSFTRESLDAKLWLWTDATSRQLDTAAQSDFAPSLSRDRRTLAFQRSQPSPEVGHSLVDSTLSVGTLEPDGRLTGLRSLLAGFAPALSPNADWLAYLVRGPSPPGMALHLRHLGTGEQLPVSASVPLPAVPASSPFDWVEQNVAWSAAGDALFYVERGPTELLRRFGLDSRQPVTLVEADAEARLRDLYVSPDGRKIGYRVRDADGDRVRARDLETGAEADFGTFEGPGTTRVRGWLGDSSALVLVRAGASQPDRSADLEVLTAGPSRAPRLVTTITRAYVATARLDSDSSTIYVTRSDNGVHNVWRLTLDSGHLTAVTSNTLGGVTFSGFGVAGPGRLLTVRDEHRQDIWLSERDGRE
ncbi:MAG TPA: protein kinase [Vicinamibacterales bacterium]|nr:protein kinase [Vicinamibacterales bacterium]